MNITALKPLSRRPGFLAIHAGGVRVGVLPVEEIRALGIRVGVELDGKGEERVLSAIERANAHDAAVRLLAVRGRSTQEIVTRLRRKGMGKDAIAHAVGRLESGGLLDDAKFAREYARTLTSRGFGRARIAADLSRKGVSRPDADIAVAEAGGDDEAERRERLLALARKRAAQLKGLDQEVARRRLVGYLARRGYGGGEVLAVVRQVVRGQGRGSASAAEAEALGRALE
jgi:regulatory protein